MQIPDVYNIANITMDDDMDVNLTLNEMLAAMIFLNRDIYIDGILIAHSGRDTVRDYPEIMGKTVEEYAKEYILSKSPDGTIEGGLAKIGEETEGDPVGWMGFYLDMQLANEYNRSIGKPPVEIFDD